MIWFLAFLCFYVVISFLSFCFGSDDMPDVLR